MKISNSKKELARIISENGGWRNGAEFTAQDGDGTGSMDFFKSKPKYDKDDKYWRGEYDYQNRIKHADVTIKNFHQTILSREEYFHLYPAPDAKPEFCESVTRSIPEPESKQTIEQLAADYRNRKDYANRKQAEADTAKAESDEALRKLELAGEAIDLIVTPVMVEKEPELVITDWRDLQVGDIVWWSGDSRFSSGEYPVYDLEERDHNEPCAILLDVGGCKQWIDHEDEEWKFICRP